MASFNHMNNTAPFWDFLASLEQQGNNHPFFGQDGQDRSNENEHGEGQEGHHGPRFEGARPPQFDPWSWGHQLFGGPGGLPHRGPQPPPPPGPHGQTPPPPGPHGPPHHDEHEPHHEHDGEKDGERSDNDNDNDNDNGEGPSGSGSDGEGGRHYRRHGHCGGRRGRHGFGGRGGCGPHGGPGRHGPRGHHGPPHDGPGRGPRGSHHGPPPHHEGPHSHCGPHHHGGPGRRGPWGRGGPFGGPGPFGGAFCGPDFQRGFNRDAASIFAPLWEAFTAEHPSNKDNDTTKKDNEDFTPEADIFDTPSSYIIHISLPGAKKEDVGVNWDAEKSEISVAGVIYRPGDEEFLKTLAMNERKVGPFERKIRLGTRANPAHVDADGITAKLEDGVLRVEVRKEDEGFVEIKKVDIE